MHNADWISGDLQILLTRGDDHSELGKRRREKNFACPFCRYPKGRAMLLGWGGDDILQLRPERYSLSLIVPRFGLRFRLGLQFANDRI